MSLFDPGRLALLCLLAVAGCAPAQRYAAYEPLYTRYELDAQHHPDSLSFWYSCFAGEDAYVRQECLSRCPGVRVSSGALNHCLTSADGTTLCRAFPLDPPRTHDDMESAGASNGDEVGDAIGSGLSKLVTALLSADDDDDDDDDTRKTRRSRSKERESYSSKNTTTRRDRESKSSYKKRPPAK